MSRCDFEETEVATFTQRRAELFRLVTFGQEENCLTDD
jgi:hypothetical protein